MNDTGVDKSKITKYLGILRELQIIERIVPITEKHPKKSRNGIYKIKDNYFKFWFRFIFENTNYVEQNKQELLLKEKILPELNSFFGRTFEDISLQFLKDNKIYPNFLFGRWWDKKDEIDILGISNKEKKVIFGEVKWKNLSKKEAEQIIFQLNEKSKKADIPDNFTKNFMIIAKKIEEKKELAKSGAIIYELKDVI